jgi:hypothetical protein
VDQDPSAGENCGEPLGQEPRLDAFLRQVTETPWYKAFVKEFRLWLKACPKCGKTTRGQIPRACLTVPLAPNPSSAGTRPGTGHSPAGRGLCRGDGGLWVFRAAGIQGFAELRRFAGGGARKFAREPWGSGHRKGGWAVFSPVSAPWIIAPWTRRQTSPIPPRIGKALQE